MQEKRAEPIEEASLDELRSVTINASEHIGQIRSLQGVNDGPISRNGVNVRESFLRFVRDNRLPLDFVRLTNMYRELLDQFGFHQTRLHLTEWNFAIESPELNPAQLSPMYQAAFVADALMYLQDSPLERAFFYRGDAGEGSLDLFNADGTFKKVTRAFEAVGTLNQTPIRLHAGGSDQNGFAVLAGCTHTTHQIRVLIGNYEIPPQVQGPIPGGNVQTIPGIATFTWPDRRSVTYANNRGYNLTIDNLPSGNDEYIVKRYRLDDTHDLSLVDTKRHRGSSFKLSATLPAPSVELIVLTKC